LGADCVGLAAYLGLLAGHRTIVKHGCAWFAAAAWRAGAQSTSRPPRRLASTCADAARSRWRR